MLYSCFNLMYLLASILNIVSKFWLGVKALYYLAATCSNFIVYQTTPVKALYNTSFSRNLKINN